MAIISLGRQLPGVSCDLPEGGGRATPGLAFALPPSARSCFRWGLPSRISYLIRWWSLTPPFHSHPKPRTAAGDLLSVALCRRVTPPGRYPASRSVKLGLSSSHPCDGPRLPGLLGHQRYSTTAAKPRQAAGLLKGRAAPRSLGYVNRLLTAFEAEPQTHERGVASQTCTRSIVRASQ